MLPTIQEIESGKCVMDRTPSPDELIRQYLTEKRAAGLSRHTLSDYRKHITKIWSGREMSSEEERRVLEEYILEPGISAGTRNSRIGNLKAFWNWMLDEGYRDRPWPKHLKKLKTDDRPAILNERTVRSILSWFRREAETGKWNDVRNYAFISLMAVSGVRPGEALDICPEDVDLSGQVIRLERTKTRMKRVIPIGGAMGPLKTLMDFHAHLRQDGYLPADALLFCGPRGERLTDSGLQGLWSEARRKAGGWHDAGLKRGACLYDLRHHFATSAVRKGLHPTVVAAVMGHASMNTTRKYVHVSDGDIASMGGTVITLSEFVQEEEVAKRKQRKPRMKKKAKD